MTKSTQWWQGPGGRVLLSLAPVALLAFTGVAGGRPTLLLGSLLVGPLLACGRLDGRHTAVVAAVTMAVALTLGALEHSLPTAEFVVQCVVLSLGGVAAARIALHRTTREAELARVAQVAQRAILRPLSLRLGGVEVATRYYSACRAAVIGGDLYDIARTPFGLRVLVGDVRGHDLEAVRLAAATIGAFRDLAYTSCDLPTLAKGLNARLAPELEPEDFVTAVFAEFARGEVRLVNCGHPPPLRIGHRLEHLSPADPSPPLGLNPDPLQQRARLGDGERLLFYTDGLTEARSPGGTLFALGEPVRAALTEPLLKDALDALHGLLEAHTVTPPHDDLALVLCQPVHSMDESFPWPDRPCRAERERHGQERYDEDRQD